MKIKRSELKELAKKYIGNDSVDAQNQFMLKVSTARCARLSYMTHDGEIDYGKDIRLHDDLLKNHHMSPFEHCARVMSDDEYYEFAKGRLLVKDGYGDGDSLEQNIDNDTHGWCNNFRGFIQYRYLIEKHEPS